MSANLRDLLTGLRNGQLPQKPWFVLWWLDQIAVLHPVEAVEALALLVAHPDAQSALACGGIEEARTILRKVIGSGRPVAITIAHEVTETLAARGYGIMIEDRERGIDGLPQANDQPASLPSVA